jgi:cell division protease FtsH
MAALAALGMLVFFGLAVPSQGDRVDYSDFKAELKKDNIKELKFTHDRLTGQWKVPPVNAKTNKARQEVFTTVLPPVEDRQLIEELSAKGVKFDSDLTNWAEGVNLLVSLLGFGLMLGLIWMVLRRSGDPMGTGSTVSPRRAAEHLRRRGGHGAGQARVAGSGRVPEEPRPVREAGRADSQGGLADGPPGDGQDPAGAGDRGRSGGSVLFDQWLRVHSNVRGGGGQSRARHVPHREREFPLHPVHRRN